MKIVYLTIYCLLFFIIKISGQEKIILDLNRISSLEAKEFLISKNLLDSKAFRDHHYICIDKKPYSTHTKSYLFNYTIDEVWNMYLFGNIKEIWSGEVIEFVASFNEKKQFFVYPHQTPEYGISTNQLIVTELHFLHDLVGIVVAHRVTAIDPTSKYIKFCYSKGGKTAGTQEITFKRIADNYTLVTHQTRYKTTNFFREKVIYPYFHTRAIDQIHQNVKFMLEKQNKKLSH